MKATVKKPTIYSRHNRPADYAGEKNKRKSMTMAGQAVTPQEIIRSMTTGIPVPQQFFDQDLSTFQKLDAIEKIDYLMDLSTRNVAMKDNIEFQIADLRKRAALEAAKKQQDEIRETVRREMQENAKNAN